MLIKISSNEHLYQWILFFLTDIFDLNNGYILWLTSSSVRKTTNQTISQFAGFKTSSKVKLVYGVKLAKKENTC